MPVLTTIGEGNDLIFSNTTSIDLSVIQNMPLPSLFYDEQSFTVSKFFKAFISSIIPYREESVFNPDAPGVIR
jgi:hypothetical protein